MKTQAITGATLHIKVIRADGTVEYHKARCTVDKRRLFLRFINSILEVWHGILNYFHFHG